MRRKGISPVISAVLLIAVAISISILVTTWVTNLTQRQISGDKSCAIDTNYIVESAKWNKSGSADHNSTLLLKITNRGKQAIYGFEVEIDNGTVIKQFPKALVNQGDISKTNKLGRERSAYIIVNLTNSSAGLPAFGRSLVTSDSVIIKVTNEACDAVASSTTSVS